MANLDLTDHPPIIYPELIRRYCNFLKENGSEPDKILCSLELANALKSKKQSVSTQRFIEVWMDTMGINSLEKIEIIE